MAMSTGVKVAIGCAVATLIVVVISVALLGFGAFWLKGKADEMTGGLDAMTAKAEEIDEWSEKANANVYTPPADGVIPEARLVKFLEVRKRVYSVYEQHKAEFDELAARMKGHEDKPTMSETLQATGTMARLATDVRLEQMKTLAEVGMSEEEYRALQVAIYQSSWASEIERDTGKLPAEALGEMAQELPGQAEEILDAARGSGAAGEAAGAGEAGQVADAMGQMMAAGTKALEVPRQNVELFRKYEADIKKYAMHGLALIGL
jgi:hypothetical protein